MKMVDEREQHQKQRIWVNWIHTRHIDCDLTH